MGRFGARRGLVHALRGSSAPARPHTAMLARDRRRDARKPRHLDRPRRDPARASRSVNADVESVRARLLAHADFRPALYNSSKDLCALFGAERISVFELNEAGDALLALLALGLEEFKQFKLPLNASTCIAAYAAVHRRM